MNVGQLTKPRRQDLSDKWELPRAYPIEEVHLDAVQGVEENACRRKSMCQNKEIRGSMVVP